MMKATKNNLREDPNLKNPTIHSPVAGGVYRSPVPVHMQGRGGTVTPNIAQHRFSPPGGYHEKEGLDGNQVANFTWPVEPGPHSFDGRVTYNETYFSDFIDVGVFYVLTPPREPATRPADFHQQITDLYLSGSTAPDMLTVLALQHANVSLREIAAVIDTLKNDFRRWQNRALDTLFTIAYVERFEVTVGDTPVNKTLYLAVGINTAGQKIPLGLWIDGNTGALQFWRRIMSELKNRGVQDILMLCAENYEGLLKAAEVEFPKTAVQYSIEHRVRTSLVNVPRKQQKLLAADLEPIFASADAKSAEQRLRQFEKNWTADYPSIGQTLHQDWPALTPYLGHPPEFHKIISTTDSIDALSAGLRKAIKTRSSFPTDDDARLLVYLSLQVLSPKKPAALKGWKAALVHFKSHFKGRV